jgi:hypothetical protein
MTKATGIMREFIYIRYFKDSILPVSIISMPMRAKLIASTSNLKQSVAEEPNGPSQRFKSPLNYEMRK